MNISPLGFSGRLVLVGSFTLINFALLAMNTTQYNFLWLGIFFVGRCGMKRHKVPNAQVLMSFVGLLAYCCTCSILYFMSALVIFRSKLVLPKGH